MAADTHTVVIIPIWLRTFPSRYTHASERQTTRAAPERGEDAALIHQSSLNSLPWCQAGLSRDTFESISVLSDREASVSRDSLHGVFTDLFPLIAVEGMH